MVKHVATKLNIMNASSFFVSAILWCSSAWRSLPPIKAFGLASMGPGAEKDFMDSLKRSAFLNLWAAGFAAAGAAFQTTSTIVELTTMK